MLIPNFNLGQQVAAGTERLGPKTPHLASTACYSIFSSNGLVTNEGNSFIIGDVGSNAGITSNFDGFLVTGTVHPSPDPSTAATAIDLFRVNNYLNLLPHNIELVYPAEFGNNLVLTPDTYLLNGNTNLTGTINFDARGNQNSVFVIKIAGALYAGIESKVVLLNGAQAKNIYWKVDNAVTIDDYSDFSGNIIVKAGDIHLKKQVIMDGRTFTNKGTITTNEIVATVPSGCGLISKYSLDKNTSEVRVTPKSLNEFININFISKI